MVVTATRALFERLPRLADLVPFAALADGLPTPVEQVDSRLWVQREEHTSSTYGGNKVRKFEFVFPIAERRGGPVLTAGQKESFARMTGYRFPAAKAAQPAGTSGGGGGSGRR